MTDTSRIARITLKDSAAGHWMSHEREEALHDLAHHSHFQPLNDNTGPYHVDLSIQDNRLVFEVENSENIKLPALVLSLKPYNGIIRDYFMMLESYEKVRADGNRAKLEAIDMGRRGLHNDAATLMLDRLKDKIDVDHDTARRIFTLVCSLQSGATFWR